MITKYWIIRSEIEDERQINHHGKSRYVKAGDADVLLTKINVASAKAKIGFDKNLVSVQDQVQDKALQKYYSKVKLSKEERTTMDRCVMFSRRIKPVIALIFVTFY